MKPLDTIYINDLQLPCLIGLYDYERTSKQIVIINVALSVDLTKPAETDNINDTVSYPEISSKIVELVDHSKFYLLEALAGAIAKVCLEDNRVKQVKVHIEKPKAIKLGKSSAVEIVRTNEQEKS